MSPPWWKTVNTNRLSQGDMLSDCRVPVFADPTPREDNTPQEVPIEIQRLIIITQSCDLENRKATFVALCPIHTLKEFASVNPHFQNSKNWEPVRRGVQHALHMLASPDQPDDNLASLVVDFGQIISLPANYLTRHAESLGNRWRLESPFLEHFSQAFARFFMRVGLPSAIPPFK